MRDSDLVVLVVFALIICCVTRVKSDASDHRYKAGDPIPVYVNKIGPFQNPSETYNYYKLPFCKPENVKHKNRTLAEMLNGDRMVTAPYRINFLEEKAVEVVCQKNLSIEEILRFRGAVSCDYYFQMYIDDLPVWQFLGVAHEQHVDDPKKKGFFLFKHINFHGYYHKDYVVEVNAFIDTAAVVDITEDKELSIELSYSVKWSETNTRFEKRMDKYLLHSSLLGHLEKHRFSIQNSCFMVLVLAGCLLTFYVKVLKKEFEFTESTNDAGLAHKEEQPGWKNIRSDVFRYPKYKSLLAAALGSGIQLLALAILILALGVVGTFYPYDRGNIWTALLVVYTITSGIAGYASASFYFQLEGLSWRRNLLLTGCIFSLPLLLTFCFLNSVAVAYEANIALPLGPIITILIIWTLVALPLLLLGGIVGKRSKPEFEAPCRTSTCPRDVPSLRWYRGMVPQMAAAGLLPFGVIFTELYYIMASLWGHRTYNLYGVLFVVFIIFVIVTALVTVALTYFQLGAEDYHWWWRSFLCGGSTGPYIYVYCLHYYFSSSDMSGFLQTSFFFGYMACICFGVFLMLGTVGFFASLMFVRHIYSCIKCD